MEMRFIDEESMGAARSGNGGRFDRDALVKCWGVWVVAVGAVVDDAFATPTC